MPHSSVECCVAYQSLNHGYNDASACNLVLRNQKWEENIFTHFREEKFIDNNQNNIIDIC